MRYASTSKTCVSHNLGGGGKGPKDAHLLLDWGLGVVWVLVLVVLYRNVVIHGHLELGGKELVELLDHGVYVLAAAFLDLVVALAAALLPTLVTKKRSHSLRGRNGAEVHGQYTALCRTHRWVSKLTSQAHHPLHWPRSWPCPQEVHSARFLLPTCLGQSRCVGWRCRTGVQRPSRRT